MKLYRALSFSTDGKGGNPAAIVLCEEPLSVDTMQAKASEVGYSETAFLHFSGNDWRIRYFAPEAEIPFCGHATLAAGVILGVKQGIGRYELITEHAEVSVSASKRVGKWMAEFESPKTFSKELKPTYWERLYECFGIGVEDLDPELPSRLIHAGANHALIALNSRRRLTHIGYSFAELLQIQSELSLATVNLVFRESENTFHARNPFAAGGVYEDPATGAAAAALAGYLRDLGIKTSGTLRVIQGEDMGRLSEILVAYDETPGSGVRIAGEVTVLPNL